MRRSGTTLIRDGGKAKGEESEEEQSLCGKLDPRI
jgi:hypothetical protein